MGFDFCSERLVYFFLPTYIAVHHPLGHAIYFRERVIVTTPRTAFLYTVRHFLLFHVWIYLFHSHQRKIVFVPSQVRQPSQRILSCIA